MISAITIIKRSWICRKYKQYKADKDRLNSHKEWLENQNFKTNKSKFMKKFMLYVSMNYVPKNKLQEALQKYFNEVNRTIYNDYGSVAKMVRNKVDEVNQEHNRCKPVKVNFFDHKMDGKRTISIHGIQAVAVQILEGFEV